MTPPRVGNNNRTYPQSFFSEYEVPKYLYVGDMHVVPEELDDCERLLQYVEQVATEQAVDAVCFLGDQTHTHAILRIEVLAFWRRWLESFRAAKLPVIMLVGNHDRPGTAGSELHSMMVFEEMARVVSKPEVIDGVLFVPYQHSAEDFLAACNQYPTKVAVCHNTFDGSKYENGMYAKDGINVDTVPQDHLISGHIHTPQEFGKVWYVGAPRWRSLSDANVERAVWVVEHDEQGINSCKPYSTGDVCRQIRYVEDTPSSPAPTDLDPQHDWRIDIRGPSSWIEQRKPLFKGQGVKVRTFKTDKPTAKVRESDGVEVSMMKFLGSYQSRFKTPRQVLEELVKERFRIQS